jgi:hypothetical protein
MKHSSKQHLQYSSFRWFFRHETLHSFGIGSPTHLKSIFYVSPHGSSSHAPKDSPLWGSLTKYYKVYTMVFTIISAFYFFKDSYSHMIFLQVLIQLTTWNHWMQIMSLKSSNLYPLYLKKKNGWIINHIHLHLFPMYQTNHQMPL